MVDHLRIAEPFAAREGEHGYGSLIRGGRGSRISFHHNLWAHHVARMPRPGNYDGPGGDPHGPLFEFRSNVFYNWGGGFAGYNDDAATLIRYNFIDNAYLAGPDSEGASRLSRAQPPRPRLVRRQQHERRDPRRSLVAGRRPIPEGYRLPGAGRGRAGRARSGAARPIGGCWPAPAPGRATRSTRASSPACAPAPAAISTARRKSAAGRPRRRAGRSRTATATACPTRGSARHGLDPERADGNGDRDGDGMTNLEDYLAERAR